jgi:hypothetical protein
MLRAHHTNVATSRYNGGQLRSRYCLQRGERISEEEVQTLHHGDQLRARATRARTDPSNKDQQGRAEQRRPAHKLKKLRDKSFATKADEARHE